MGENVKSLAAARVFKEENNSLWTPAECAEHFIDRIAKGEIKPESCVIVYQVTRENGKGEINTIRCNINDKEEIFLLDMAHYFALKYSVDDD